MFADFERFTFEMTLEQAKDASHAGDCYQDVIYLLTLPKIKRQLKKILDEMLIAELLEYGVWNNEELQNRQNNEERIVWLAAGDISENYKEKKRLKNAKCN